MFNIFEIFQTLEGHAPAGASLIGSQDQVQFHHADSTFGGASINTPTPIYLAQSGANGTAVTIAQSATQQLQEQIHFYYHMGKSDYPTIGPLSFRYSPHDFFLNKDLNYQIKQESCP